MIICERRNTLFKIILSDKIHEPILGKAMWPTIAYSDSTYVKPKHNTGPWILDFR